MQVFKKIAKNGLLVSSIIGLYYLSVFTFNEGVPFPLDVSILPTMLIALGMLCLIFTIVVTLYSFISIIVVTDPLDIGYEELMFSRPYWVKSKELASFFNFIIFFCFNPLMFVVFAVNGYTYMNGFMAFSFLVMPALFVYYALTPNRKIKDEGFHVFKTFHFWRSYITFFYIGFLAILSAFVFLKYLEFGIGIESDQSFIIALLIFLVLSYFILLPPRKKSGFQKTAEMHSKEEFFKKLLRVPAFYVYALVLALALIPDIALNTASVSFRFLQVGGGIERSYYFTRKSRVTIPPELIDFCDQENDYCQTKSLKVVLDLGGVLYVKGPYLGGVETVVSLPKSSLYLINQKRGSNNENS